MTTLTGRFAQPHGVDIVRAFFKWPDFQVSGFQGGTKSKADGGFARRFMGGGNEKVTHGN
jgi:hypothetical protein